MGLLDRILEPECEEVCLSCETCSIVELQVLHEVEPKGRMQFHAEFYRALAA